MTYVSIVACTVICWGLVAGRFGSVTLAWFERFVPNAGVARACAVAILPVFAVQLALLAFQAHVENGPPTSGWLRELPVPVYDHLTERASVHAKIAYAGLALAALETLLVGLVAFALHREKVRFSLGFAALLGVGIACISIAAPAMATTDPYEYIASGMLGFRSYAPGPSPFAGTIYAPIDLHVPMRGVLYGPLWLAIDTVVTAAGSTILAKLIALRVFNALLIGALLWVLARAGVSRAALWALGLNPGIWFYVVVNPHADIEALVAVAGAFALAERGKGIPAMLLVVAAGLIKIPFVLAGAAAFVPLTMFRRISLWLCAAALTFTISYLIPGPVYLAGVAGHVHVWSSRAEAVGAAEYVYIIPFVCAFMVAFVAFRRSFAGAAWLFGQLSPLAAPWYLLWGMPYAFAGRTFVLYLVPLPFLMMIRDYMYVGTPVGIWMDVLVMMAFLFDLYLVARRRMVQPARYIL